jgi:hypothetical protein
MPTDWLRSRARRSCHAETSWQTVRYALCEHIIVNQINDRGLCGDDLVAVPEGDQSAACEGGTYLGIVPGKCFVASSQDEPGVRRNSAGGARGRPAKYALAAARDPCQHYRWHCGLGCHNLVHPLESGAPAGKYLGDGHRSPRGCSGVWSVSSCGRWTKGRAVLLASTSGCALGIGPLRNSGVAANYNPTVDGVDRRFPVAARQAAIGACGQG